MSVKLGVISLSRSVYGKANSVIPMIISAQDGGGLVALANARVNISVVAGLVAPPVFEQTQYYFTVSEDVLRGTVLGIVQANTKIGGDACSVYIYHTSRMHEFLSCSPAPLVQIDISSLNKANSKITSVRNSVS